MVKKIALFMLVGMVALFGFSATSYATLAIQASSGASSVTIQDNGAGDNLNTVAGAISVNLTNLNGWTTPQLVGLLSGSASSPEFDLNFGSFTSTGANPLTIKLSETGFTSGPAGFDMTAGGIITNGNLTIQAFWDSGNGLFATTNSILTLGPLSTAGAYNSDISGFGGNTGPYSLTLVATLTGKSSADADLSGSPVPIPPAIWLLGSGLFGMIGIRRRFKK